MDVEENVAGAVDGFHHRGAKGDVVHKMAIHHIEVHPVGPGGDCAADLIAGF